MEGEKEVVAISNGADEIFTKEMVKAEQDCMKKC
jgi:hypothetical protein